MIIEEDDFLEHFGVKGMQWGVRKAERQAQRKTHKENKQAIKDRKDEAWGKTRAERRANYKHYKGELDSTNKRNSDAFKKAKDSADKAYFDSEVAATRKKQGITGKNLRPEMTSGEVFTNKMFGDFKDSKGRKVSEDFANAVLSEARTKNQRARMAKVGATYAAAFVIGASPAILRKMN